MTAATASRNGRPGNAARRLGGGPGAGAARAGRRWALGQRPAVLLGIAALALIVLLPLGSVVLQAVFPGLFQSPPSYRFDPTALFQVLSSAGDARMLADSFLLSLGAGVAGAVVGGALAIVLGRTDVAGRGIWTALIWCVLLLPSFLYAEGWTFLLQRRGLLSDVLHEPAWMQRVFATPVGVGAILALKFYPFAFLTVGAALPWLGGEHEAAARTLGAGRARIWWRISGPLLLPFAVSGAAMVFADVLSDFGVAITVAESHRFPLLTYGIYSAIYDVPTNFAGAGAFALLLLGAVGAAVAAQSLLLGRLPHGTIHTGFRPAARVGLGRWRAPVTALVAAFFALSALLPVGSVLLESVLRSGGFSAAVEGWTPWNYVDLFTPSGAHALGALLYSLRLAAVAATAAVAFGTALAFLGTEPGAGWLGQVLHGVALWTISIPGIVLAAGYAFFWNQPWLVPLRLDLYGTVGALLLAYLAGATPYVLRFQLSALGQFDRRLLGAGRVLGAGPGRLLLRIVLRLLADGALSLWLFVLAGTAFELPASEFLYPSGHPPLAVIVNHYFNQWAYGTGTALAVTAAAILIALVLVLRALLRRLLPGVPAAEPEAAAPGPRGRRAARARGAPAADPAAPFGPAALE